MNPEEVAPIEIDGLLRQREVIIPGFLNKTFLLLDTFLPPFVKKMLTNHQMKNVRSVTALGIK